ncbi:UNVERIFIED_CONTAM: Phosphatidylserine decarboxylase proenzyme 1, mitochondrial [Sesamum latifolium]|uniref:Phosphatidylserine decarboxylase proenzyme 1, mitochondrial n=1 Tax=Sesamum latifolium TaxID=2727402 RepID=A0AAW2SRT3_9LAMI
MKWRGCRSVPVLNYNRFYHQRRFHFTTFLRKGQRAQPRASAAGSNGSSSQGNSFLVPGATVATILMLGALHARRLYDDKKIEEARAKGVEFEFHPDVKARFLRLLPLRSISRFWGSLTGMELPIWLRSHVYKAWARAFHSNLEEAELPLEEYTSLRDFFVCRLKEGLRPIDSDSCCLVTGNKILEYPFPLLGMQSPDCLIILCYYFILDTGQSCRWHCYEVWRVKGPGAMIEQVKGFCIPSGCKLVSSYDCCRRG